MSPKKSPKADKSRLTKEEIEETDYERDCRESREEYEKNVKTLYKKNPTAKSDFDLIGTKDELRMLYPFKQVVFTESSTETKAKIKSIIGCVLTVRGLESNFHSMTPEEWKEALNEENINPFLENQCQ